MWRAVFHAFGVRAMAIAVAMATVMAAILLAPTGGNSPTPSNHNSPTPSNSFEARWRGLEPASKQDRLAPPHAVTGAPTRIIALDDPFARVTILMKVEDQPGRGSGEPGSGEPMRGESSQGTPRTQKLPLGCEPLFSPVSVPAMAHVTGRCLSSVETERRFAEIGR